MDNQILTNSSCFEGEQPFPESFRELIKEYGLCELMANPLDSSDGETLDILPSSTVSIVNTNTVDEDSPDSEGFQSPHESMDLYHNAPDSFGQQSVEYKMGDDETTDILYTHNMRKEQVDLELLFTEDKFNGELDVWKIIDTYGNQSASSSIDQSASFPDTRRRQLVIKNGFDIYFRKQYKTDTFRSDGSKSPHYLFDRSEIYHPILTFPEIYMNENNLLVEAVLLTVPYNNQYYYHVDKFQCDNKNDQIIDRNPSYYKIDQQHILTGEIQLKIAIIVQKLISEMKGFKIEPFKEDRTVCEPIFEKLPQKQFNDKYNLQNIVLMFTLCKYMGNEELRSTGGDGSPLINNISSYDVERFIETKVISTVIEGKTSKKLD
ncbi:unnamed protein product [Didymodactylos carnosus]|uniref:Uncharacterized protein n=1 Tax=Didymodactylos carnosus TaxID=1234261 RepID=A0A8S2DVU0_9BILA|nr:unnamed protein product [Didymodactylos carnosus]CAF3815651.1 unnamed protein product [Didymodactylos carnosus]